MNINLNIEELILYDFNPADQDQIAAAVKQELTRLISEQGLPPTLAHGGDMAHIDGGQFTMTANTPTESIGTQVAQQIYSGLTANGL